MPAARTNYKNEQPRSTYSKETMIRAYYYEQQDIHGKPEMKMKSKKNIPILDRFQKRKGSKEQGNGVRL